MNNTYEFYNIAYMLTNIFGSYIIFKIFSIFYDRDGADKRVEFLSFTGYYLFNSFLYLHFNNVLALVFTNIMCFMLLSYNYKATFRERILNTIYIYFILLISEVSIVELLDATVDIDFRTELEHISLYYIGICELVKYCLVIIVSKYKSGKDGESIPNSYWFAVALVPTLSIVLIFLVVSSANKERNTVEWIFSIILAINFAVFYLYDQMIDVFKENYTNANLKQRNEYYENQLELIQSNIKDVRMIKHDMKNHLMVLQTYYNSGNLEGYNKYMSKIFSELSSEKKYVSSGNVTIDSILNYKLKKLEDTGTQISVQVENVEDINVPEFVLTTILGNLIDNATEALDKLDDEKEIFILIIKDRDSVIIQIDNSYDGTINKSINKSRLLTRKEDKENHGLGIASVQKAVDSVNGKMEITYDEDMFSVTVNLESQC